MVLQGGMVTPSEVSKNNGERSTYVPRNIPRFLHIPKSVNLVIHTVFFYIIDKPFLSD